jgi:hypothetical protein
MASPNGYIRRPSFKAILNSVKMCFPCWKYEDVTFEERPKGPKVTKMKKHPHTGTVYATAGYYVPAPMVPALAPVPIATMNPTAVPISRPVVPVLRPIAPTVFENPVSNSAIFLVS